MIDRHGETVPRIQENILPQSMEVDPQLGVAIACAIAGFLLIFMIEKVAAMQNSST